MSDSGSGGLTPAQATQLATLGTAGVFRVGTAGIPTFLPSLAGVTNVAPASAGAGAYGAWTALSTDVGASALELIGFAIDEATTFSGNRASIQFGVGASGAEAEISEHYFSNDTLVGSIDPVFLPTGAGVVVPAHARLSARTAIGNSGVVTIYPFAMVVPAPV